MSRKIKSYFLIEEKMLSPTIFKLIQSLLIID